MRSAIGTMGIGLMLSAWLAGAAEAARTEARGTLTVGGLRWDGRENPLGLIQFEPRLRWVVSARPGAARGERQTAWQVLVASEPARLRPGLTDVWDSGKVVAPDSAAASINVRYGGPSPEARHRLYWTVRVWDAADRPSAFAPAAWAEMGLLDEEWEGQWIGRPQQGWQAPAPGARDGVDRSVALLRRPFAVAGGVARARLYVSALGLYEVRMNGARIGAAELAPGYTAYAKRVLFQTHDVTALVRRGDNVLGAVVAGGWCTARAGGHAGVCGADPGRIMVQLEVTLASGERQVIVSDSSWQAHPGPWLSAHLTEGERYDARRELPGWDRPGGDAGGWRPAQAYDKKIERDLVADPAPPLQVTEELRPVAVSAPRAGVYLLDLGQTIVGWAQLATRAPAGRTITLRYLEAPAAAAGAPTDSYVSRGGAQRWQARFSLKRFRYLEVEGLPGRPAAGSVVGRRVQTLMAPVARLETANPRLQRLLSWIDGAQRSAFVSVPHAAGPGNAGDLLEARAFAATSCLYRDVQGFSRKWIDDIRDAQLPDGAYTATAPAPEGSGDAGPGGAAGVMLPLAVHRCYADRTILDAHLPSMGRWLARIRAANPDLVWSRALGASPGDPGEHGPRTDASLIATAELAAAAQAVATMIRPAGSAAQAEVQRHEALAAGARAAFVRRFVAADGKLTGDTQTAYALALALGLVPPEREAAAGRHLVEALGRQGPCPATGLLGTAHLLPALSRIGRDDLAYAVLLDERCPRDAPGASYAAGAVGAWMMEAIGGIALDPEAPAGRHLRVRPRPGGGLASARARYHSLYGPVQTEWWQQGDSFRLKLTVPANATATVVLPFGGGASEGGQPLARARGVQVLRQGGDDGELVIAVVSGSYDFQVRRQPGTTAAVAQPAAGTPASLGQR